MSEPRRVVVVGGSRGIGQAVVERFLRNGDRVLSISRSVPGGGQHPPGVTYASVDLAGETAPQQVIEAAAKHLGGIDVLCLVAGIFPSCPLAEMTREAVDDVFAVNLTSQILTVAKAVPMLRESVAPRVVLMSSITGPVTGYPGWSHYGATKAGQLGFMRTAALELAPYQITVNAVAPGSVATEALADMGEDYLEAATSVIPLGRLAATADIAEAVFFFASPAAGYITGQCLAVDGGQTLPETPEAVLPLAQ